MDEDGRNGRKCHFRPFLPSSSRSQPPSWKLLPVAKTPENSTLRAYRLILPAYDTIRSHFRHYRTKIRKMTDQNRRVKNQVCSTLRITCIVFFSKHYLPIIVNTIYYHLLNYPYYTNYDTIQYTIIFTTIISIYKYCYHYVIHCNYIVTILISTIYRYILSIKLPLTRKRQHTIINIDINILIQ